MNNNLTPEVRADVNGKLVTRHVKVNAGDKNRKSKLPAPASPPSTTDYYSNINALKDAIASAIGTGEYDDIDAVQESTLVNHLQNIQPHIVQAYRDQIEEQPDCGYEDLLISVLANKLNSSNAGYVLFVSQNKDHSRGMENGWDEDINGTHEYEESLGIHKGLKLFSRDTGFSIPDDIFKADDEAINTVGALSEMLSRGNDMGLEGVDQDWGDSTIFFNHIDLGKLAMEQPDRIKPIVDLMSENEIVDAGQVRAILVLEDEYPDDKERVISIIKERNTSDPEVVRKIIAAEVQALSSGVL